MFLVLSVCVFISTFVSCGQGVYDNEVPSFTNIKSWPDPAVNSLPFYGSGVALNKHQNIVVLHRGSKSVSSHWGNTSIYIQEDVVLILSSKSGTVVATWGKDKFVKPHGLEISRENIFITDIKLHQVFKFSHDPHTGLWKNDAEIVLGEAFTSGSDPFHFCSPTSVAILNSGDFFVADGYCNSRVVKFNENGFYRGEFGAGSSNPIQSWGFKDFNVTHSITIAQWRNPNDNLSTPIIFVADRNNKRVQSFFENGTFLYEIPFQKFGLVNEMLLSVTFHPTNGILFSVEEPFGTLYAVIGHLPVGHSQIFEILVGKSSYHIRSSFPYSNLTKEEPMDKNNKNLNRNIGLEQARLETPHDMTVSKDGNTLYVIEAYQSLIVKKFVKTRKDFLSSTKSDTIQAYNINRSNIAITFLYLFLVHFHQPFLLI